MLFHQCLSVFAGLKHSARQLFPPQEDLCWCLSVPPKCGYCWFQTVPHTSGKTTSSVAFTECFTKWWAMFWLSSQPHLIHRNLCASQKTLYCLLITSGFLHTSLSLFEGMMYGLCLANWIWTQQYCLSGCLWLVLRLNFFLQLAPHRMILYFT